MKRSSFPTRLRVSDSPLRRACAPLISLLLLAALVPGSARVARAQAVPTADFAAGATWASAGFETVSGTPTTSGGVGVLPRGAVVLRPAGEASANQHIIAETDVITVGGSWGGPRPVIGLRFGDNGARAYNVLPYIGNYKVFRTDGPEFGLPGPSYQTNPSANETYFLAGHRIRFEGWKYALGSVVFLRLDVRDLTAGGTLLYRGVTADTTATAVTGTARLGLSGSDPDQDSKVRSVAFNATLPPLTPGTPTATGISGGVRVTVSSAGDTAGAYTVQWQRKATGTSDGAWANLSGATALTYTDNSAAIGTSYDYRAIQGDGLGQSVTTAAVSAEPLANVPALMEGGRDWPAYWAANPGSGLFTHIAAQTGRWDSPSTWNTGTVPTATSNALVPAGLKVSAGGTDTAYLVAVEPGGTLALDSTRAYDGLIHTIHLSPRMSGTGAPAQLDLGGTRTQPLPADIVHRLRLGGGPMPARFGDNDQIGGGIVGYGLITGYAAPKTRWVRATGDLLTGQTQFTADRPLTGWRVGDKLPIADTTSPRYRVLVQNRTDSWSTTVTITAISGRTVTFSPPLAHDYLGSQPKYRADRTPVPNSRRFTLVGNLTSNITLESADPSTRLSRAHIIVIGGGQADLSNVALWQLGKTTLDPLDPGTNKVGRYPLHFHHANGPYTDQPGGYRARVIGCVVWGAPKWGFVSHTSTALLFQNNLVFDVGGAAYVDETASTAYVDWFANAAIKVSGTLTGPNLGTNVPETGEQPRRQINPSDIFIEGMGGATSATTTRWVGNVFGDTGAGGLVIQPVYPAATNFPIPPAGTPATPDVIKRLIGTAYNDLQNPFGQWYLYDLGEDVFAQNEAFAVQTGAYLINSAPLTLRDTTTWNTVYGIQARHADIWIVKGADLRGDWRPDLPFDLASRANSTGYGDKFGTSYGFWNNAFRVLYRSSDIYAQGWDQTVLHGTALGAAFPGRALDDVAPPTPTRSSGVPINLFMDRALLLVPPGKAGLGLAYDHHYHRRKDTMADAVMTDLTIVPFVAGSAITEIAIADGMGNDRDPLSPFSTYLVRYNGRSDTLKLYAPTQEPNALVPISSNRDAAGNIQVPTQAEKDAKYADKPEIIAGQPIRFGLGKRVYPVSEGGDGQEHFNIGGIPEKGLTNTQAKAKYNLSLNGEITPPGAFVVPSMVGYDLNSQPGPIKAISLPAPPVQWKDTPHLQIGNMDVSAARIYIDTDRNTAEGHKFGTHSGSATGEMRAPFTFDVLVNDLRAGQGGQFRRAFVMRADSLQLGGTQRTAAVALNPWPAWARDGLSHQVKIRDVVSGVWVTGGNTLSEPGDAPQIFTVTIPAAN